MHDRLKFPANGFAGGKHGGRGHFSLTDGMRPYPKTRYTLPPEHEVVLRLPGGGGFYPPFEHDPELVRQGVLDGYVSREAARSDYGV